MATLTEIAPKSTRADKPLRCTAWNARVFKVSRCRKEPSQRARPGNNGR
jgi:hypothetical protein